jgi:predicted enzyme related to lactoylglutathione lyase
MRLSKDRLDVGLMTDDPAMIDFMADDVGLGDHEVLPVTSTVTQHRFDVDGSVVKVNLVDGLDTERRSGFSEVVIADASVTAPRRCVGPDAVVVTVVPPGNDGVDQLGVRLRVPDLDRATDYFARTLGWDVDGPTVRLGATVVLLEENHAAPAAVEMPVRGWTYLTVQIHDCDAETAGAVDRGATLAQPAMTLGEVARFSMIADPWGNRLELSQRASLTGPLPRGAEPPHGAAPS